MKKNSPRDTLPVSQNILNCTQHMINKSWNMNNTITEFYYFGNSCLNNDIEMMTGMI